MTDRSRRRVSRPRGREGQSQITRVGVISDTHGLLRPEALSCLEGSQVIIHAGDIGPPDLLETLRRIAPVVAVRGNMDTAPWAKRLRETETLELAGVRLFVVHDGHRLLIDPALEGFTAVITGHSHRPESGRRNGVLFFNPGSAGPRRFRLPVSLGRLTITTGRVRGEIVQLDGGGGESSP